MFVVAIKVMDSSIKYLSLLIDASVDQYDFKWSKKRYPMYVRAYKSHSTPHDSCKERRDKDKTEHVRTITFIFPRLP